MCMQRTAGYSCGIVHASCMALRVQTCVHLAVSTLLLMRTCARTCVYVCVCATDDLIRDLCTVERARGDTEQHHNGECAQCRGCSLHKHALATRQLRSRIVPALAVILACVCVCVCVYCVTRHRLMTYCGTRTQRTVISRTKARCLTTLCQS